MKYALALTAGLCLIGSQAFAASDFEFTFDNDDPASFIYQDLEKAAAKYCTHAGYRGLAERRREAQCMDYVIGDVIAQVGSPKLTAYHASVLEGERPSSLAGDIGRSRS